MKIGMACYDCILKQIPVMARLASESEAEQRRMIRRLLRILTEADEETSPPEVASSFYREVRSVSGINDFFRREKDESTRIALSLYPALEKLTGESPDPFESALRLAIGGNIIDYGATPDFSMDGLEERIHEVLEHSIDYEALERLRSAMEQADSIFYILDNCGEAVLDRLLISQFAPKITLGVRGEAVLNDVTRREAEMSGLGHFTIYDTGDMAPGVSLRNSHDDFLRAMRRADLVVAKGQGNFETLTDYDRPIAFLLRIKCGVIAGMLDDELYSLQIQLRNFK